MNKDMCVCSSARVERTGQCPCNGLLAADRLGIWEGDLEYRSVPCVRARPAHGSRKHTSLLRYRLIFLSLP